MSCYHEDRLEVAWSIPFEEPLPPPVPALLDRAGDAKSTELVPGPGGGFVLRGRGDSVPELRVLPARAPSPASSPFRSSLEIRGTVRRTRLLREKKVLLSLLRPLLEREEQLLFDLSAQKIWTPELLDDELRHDADLDVTALFALHAVTGDRRSDCVWLHSHGLAAAGAFDLDVLRPSAATLGAAEDLYRALAWWAISDRMRSDTNRHRLALPGGWISLVPAGSFQQAARAEHRQLRDDPTATHFEDRSVVCEALDPGGRRVDPADPAPDPCRWLSRGVPERLSFELPPEGVEAGRRRAVATWPLLREVIGELAPLPLTTFVLLAARPGATEAGNGPTWLRARVLGDTRVEISREPDGGRWRRGREDRRTASLEEVLDWRIETAAGRITSRDLSAVRILTAVRSEFRGWKRKRRRRRRSSG